MKSHAPRARPRAGHRAGKPLPADQSTALAEKDAALQNAWFERNVIQAYRKVGRRDPKWDGPAEAFLRESAASFLGLAPAATLDLRARAKVVLDAGCGDPAVLFFAARAAVSNDKQSREASEMFERAVAGMHETVYPRGLARFVASGLRDDFDRRDEGTGKRAALDPVELRWFKESLTDGSYGADEDVVFATHLISGSGNWLFSRNLAAVTSAVEATPWVDPWVRLLLKGERQIDEAWNSRGVRYASKVKEEEWKGDEGEPGPLPRSPDRELEVAPRPSGGGGGHDQRRHGGRGAGRVAAPVV